MSEGGSMDLANRRRFLPRAISALGAALILASLALGQDGVDAGTAENAAAGESVFSWILRSLGLFFWPQLAISIAIVAIITSNFLLVRRSNFYSGSFPDQFEEMTKNRDYKGAFELARQENSTLGRVLVAGLQRVRESYAEAQQTMQEVAEEEAMKFEHRLSYLAMLGNIATMVGLLGTVSGMVASFSVIARSESTVDPGQLAEGVSQALLTTVFGLIQAIPAIIFFTILKNIATERMTRVGSLAERLAYPYKKAFAASKEAK